MRPVVDLLRVRDRGGSLWQIQLRAAGASVELHRQTRPIQGFPVKGGGVVKIVKSRRTPMAAKDSERCVQAISLLDGPVQNPVAKAEECMPLALLSILERWFCVVLYCLFLTGWVGGTVTPACGVYTPSASDSAKGRLKSAKGGAVVTPSVAWIRTLIVVSGSLDGVDDRVRACLVGCGHRDMLTPGDGHLVVSALLADIVGRVGYREGRACVREHGVTVERGDCSIEGPEVFPPAPPDVDLMAGIASDFCSCMSELALRESCCAVCGTLTLHSAQTAVPLKDDIFQLLSLDQMRHVQEMENGLGPLPFLAVLERRGTEKRGLEGYARCCEECLRPLRNGRVPRCAWVDWAVYFQLQAIFVLKSASPATVAAFQPQDDESSTTESFSW
ncbi:hypothetical protein BXZ70DRAFT_906712 [Cristinia sonorae]|uniref:Uncharacterized protein n=1 Tax=Cristinia sonorae TaxID=1940300 RepID=A0A8K0URA3_9AGAR|nr:hypothetical protein BXZ70DRAFT_906712 [Cristinia sonorae]